MTRKKSDQMNSPFEKLKGLSLHVKENKKVSAPSVALPASREIDFEGAMKELGVHGFIQDEEIVDYIKGDQGYGISEPLASSFTNQEVSDEELFLRSMFTMDTVFTDELPDLEIPSASPRRMKLVERGELTPSEVLDLHGCTRNEAVRKTAFFLENAVHHRYKLILVITGWGKHVGGESVLRDEVVKYLRGDGAVHVSEWGVAPKRLGGQGAIVVFPKSPKK